MEIRSKTAVRFSTLVEGRAERDRAPASNRVVGILPGEGVGPEVIDVTLQVLSAVESIGDQSFDRRTGPVIGTEAVARGGSPLSQEADAFCNEVIDAGGALLCGPGGERFVYDLRRRFDLFCKLSPLRPFEELRAAGPLMEDRVREVDVLAVREGCGGLYQGDWSLDAPDGTREASHSFTYREDEVRRIVVAAARMAAARRGHLTVVVKRGGVPTITDLWREVSVEVAEEVGVECGFLDVDYAAYLLVHSPRDVDVIVAPNMFGDVISDLGAVLLGSRGLSFGGSFSSGTAAAYQTNHGAAHDLTGTDRANPVGQILSLAMMLRESFGLEADAGKIEAAVRAVWREGWRTEDIAEPGCEVVGTRRMGELIAERVSSGR
jgi:3-isopropylmalate dehydrogenase